MTSDARLREIHFGQWEGLTFAEAQTRQPAAMQHWLAQPLTACAPDGERVPQVQARVQTAIDDIARRYSQQRVLLVTHGGPIKLMLMHWQQLMPDVFWQLQIAPASLTEVVVDGSQAHLIRVNDTRHLQEEHA